jgi:hypothetical protein
MSDQHGFVIPPKRPGCWVIGGLLRVYVIKKPSRFSRWFHWHLLEWKWEDAE